MKDPMHQNSTFILSLKLALICNSIVIDNKSQGSVATHFKRVELETSLIVSDNKLRVQV